MRGLLIATDGKPTKAKVIKYNEKNTDCFALILWVLMIEMSLLGGLICLFA